MVLAPFWPRGFMWIHSFGWLRAQTGQHAPSVMCPTHVCFAPFRAPSEAQASGNFYMQDQVALLE